MPDEKPKPPVPASSRPALDRAAVERVLARAAELHATGADGGEGGALTESQVIAYFITWFLLVLLSILGLIADQLGNPGIRAVLSYVAFDSHLQSFARGVIDTRDIVFFSKGPPICWPPLM